MYERLKRLYKAGSCTEAMLDKAITFGWITEEQKAEIIAAAAETAEA